MKRKIEKLIKDGTPATFKLRCGSTITLERQLDFGWPEYSWLEGGEPIPERGVRITINDPLDFASTEIDFGEGLTFRNRVVILTQIKGLKSLAKITAAFAEVV